MPDEQVFMMGKFAARLPTDRRYAKNHMWAKAEGAGWVVGFSAYAVRLLQDVYFLDWHVQAGAALAERQEIGEIESSKAESALYSPLAGQLREINAAVLKDPSAINVDNYGAGWLLAIDGAGQELLSIDEYLLHLESAWKVAERTIKGQFNE
jgi:glycine cleavage system H protein